MIQHNAIDGKLNLGWTGNRGSRILSVQIENRVVNQSACVDLNKAQTLMLKMELEHKLEHWDDK